ncbi:AAA+ ATPase domain [Macleaya cordata]|uniref:AAA+ ATPase domain n=1 Tax=Macleaya cordata TaxID=56857 RepID=A0A200R8W0_MACCD|nr:AAA+ ATPase domain [Macleaya cordata]
MASICCTPLMEPMETGFESVHRFRFESGDRPIRTPSLSLTRIRSINGLKASSNDGFVVVEDDLHALLEILPPDLRENLQNDPKRTKLIEVILDLGRYPEARFLGESGGQYLRSTEVSMKELEEAQNVVGEFGGDNRAGIEGTLHRISAIRSRKGLVVGLTCRVGRAISGHIDMVHDLLQYGESILFLGRPGVGKTTVMREMARVLADELHKRVVIVDTSNEIGGDGDIPHAAIGGARRMQVPEPSLQHKVMIEAVENHMPEVILVDEIGSEAESLACRSIAERGVMLIGTAHGELLVNIIKNPTLSDLIGGVETVTLGDDEARARRCQKSILERKGPPTFPFLIEMRERNYWVTHREQKFPPIPYSLLIHGLDTII